MSEFGRVLAEYRTRAGISQSRLAERAGYDHSYPSRLETGTRHPTRDAVLNLAQTLNLNAADTARLLASAGFVAETDPLVSELSLFLSDATVPAEVRDDIRNMVGVLIRQGRRMRQEAA